MKRFLAVVLAAVLVIGLSAGSYLSVTASESGATSRGSDSWDDMNQYEFVLAMGAGWNLGNQLEASSRGIPNETAWNNPVITEEFIKTVRAQGFRTIRVPVSYLRYIGEGPDYVINPAWLDRVQEVIDMCIDNDLYVITNMHGDGYGTVTGSWLLCNSQDQEIIKAKYEACWRQIATRFKDYDEHLVFESCNEISNDGYTDPDPTYYSNLNSWNQIFVDTVRKTGGNNAKRWLIVPGWYASLNYTLGDYGFVMPSDEYLSKEVPEGEKRLMVSIHYYDPYDFCGEKSDEVTQWGESAEDSSKISSYGDPSGLLRRFKKLDAAFMSKGYPVAFTEYGAIDKSEHDPLNVASRVEYANTMCTYAKQYGCVPVWWDNGVAGTYGYSLFDRTTCTVLHQDIIDGMMTVYGVTKPETETETEVETEVETERETETEITTEAETYEDGLIKVNGKWVYVVDGCIDEDYNGIGANANGEFIIVDGTVDFSLNGLIYAGGGVWAYVKNGKVVKSYNGLCENEHGTWVIVNGYVDFSLQGLVQTSWGWYYVINGEVQVDYTGVQSNANGNWYVVDGKIDFSYNVKYNKKMDAYIVRKGKLVIIAEAD